MFSLIWWKFWLVYGMILEVCQRVSVSSAYFNDDLFGLGSVCGGVYLRDNEIQGGIFSRSKCRRTDMFFLREFGYRRL